MATKALAYVSDIILGRTGEVISREAQKDAIRKHAAQNGIEIVAWFEDEAYNEDVMSRPGVRKLLACPEACDLVLVERVWSLSRNWNVLRKFLEEVDRKASRIETVATLWDCCSQQARHHFAHAAGRLQPVRPLPQEADERARHHVRRPQRLHFLHLARKPSSAS